jgi:hypothetical protein
VREAREGRGKGEGAWLVGEEKSGGAVMGVGGGGGGVVQF